jgi:hypothetical protein
MGRNLLPFHPELVGELSEAGLEGCGYEFVGLGEGGGFGGRVGAECGEIAVLHEWSLKNGQPQPIHEAGAAQRRVNVV